MSQIQYKKFDVNAIEYSNIVFLSLAEAGAMGSPGEIVVASKRDGVSEWYAFNYLIDIPGFEVTEFLPLLKNFDCGVFGDVSGVSDGWNYFNLGAGNHLFVAQNAYAFFAAKVESLAIKHPALLYRMWKNIACEILEGL